MRVFNLLNIALGLLLGLFSVNIFSANCFAGGYYGAVNGAATKTQTNSAAGGAVRPSKYMDYKNKFSVYNQQQAQQQYPQLNPSSGQFTQGGAQNLRAHGSVMQNNTDSINANNPLNSGGRSNPFGVSFFNPYKQGVKQQGESAQQNNLQANQQGNQQGNPQNINPLLPSKTKDEKQQAAKKNQPPSLKSFIAKMSGGFELSGYSVVGGGSGKYDFQVGNGWNVYSVSPDITGSQNSSFNTSSGLNQTYQNIANDQKLNSKLTFGSIAFALKLKMPSFIGINDENVMRPFAFAEFGYNTIKPLKIEGNKEVGYSKSGANMMTFNNISSKYKYDGLKYTNIVGIGMHFYAGLYAMYAKDIFLPKNRIEAGYDFGNTIFFIAREELNYESAQSLDPATNIAPKIKYESIIAGLRFKVL